METHDRPAVPSEGDRVKRILFVDDDPNVLAGLRNLLRKQHKQWDTTFVVGGAAALECIQQWEFDVVISDLRMPGIDGAQVLTALKERNPITVRMILSGESDRETALRTVFVAHQFLAKPCDSETLRNCLTRACRLNDLVQSELVRAAVGDVSMLPPTPGTALSLTRALAAPGTSMADIAKLVEEDPSLCAKILQLVNSAFFGLPRPVSSIRDATTFLGGSTLRTLALAMEALKLIGRGAPQASLALQRHALLTADIARAAMAQGKGKGDDAFIAGILHDIGLLIPLPSTSDVDHAAAGAYLLDLWGLPHAIVEAVAFHNHPQEVDHEKLDIVDAVYVANWLATDVLREEVVEGPIAALDEAYLQTRGVSLAELTTLRAGAEKAVVDLNRHL